MMRVEKSKYISQKWRGIDNLSKKKMGDDAFGKFIIDGWADHSVMYITERSDGYIGICNRDGLYFNEYKDWTQLDKKVLKLVKGKVLDIGAGGGRVAKYLQDIGYDVTATDISPGCIEVCQKLGIKKTKIVGIEKLDNFFEQNTFDSILLMGHNLGLLQYKNKARKILQILDRISKKEAIIIAHTMDPTKTNNSVHRLYQKNNIVRGRLPGQIRMRVRYSVFKDSWSDYTFWREKDVKDAILTTNWKIKGVLKESVGFSYYVILEKKE